MSILMTSILNSVALDYGTVIPLSVAATSTSTNITTEEFFAKIQPYLIPENRVNPNTPLCKSFGGPCDIYVYRLPNSNPSVLVFQSSGAVDCDGQRTNECNEITDDQYQSQTSFKQSNGQPLIASVLPYYVLPDHGNYFNYANFNIQGGQLGLIMYGREMNYGVFGDENADTHKSGEVSYAMAKSLGFNPDPANGGVPFGVWFIIFTGSGNVVSPIEDHPRAVTMGSAAMNILLNQLGTPTSPRGYVNGTVRDSLGIISEVTVTSSTGVSTITDANGFYSLSLMNGTYQLNASKEPVYYLNGSVSVTVTAFNTITNDIILNKKPVGAIRGIVSNI